MAQFSIIGIVIRVQVFSGRHLVSNSHNTRSRPTQKTKPSTLAQYDKQTVHGARPGEVRTLCSVFDTCASDENHLNNGETLMSQHRQECIGLGSAYVAVAVDMVALPAEMNTARARENRDEPSEDGRLGTSAHEVSEAWITTAVHVGRCLCRWIRTFDAWTRVLHCNEC
jgi:hypothetical protein